MYITLTQKKIIINTKGGGFFRKLHPQWLHDGPAIRFSQVELRVQVRQQRVAGADGVAHNLQVLLRQEVRLPALRVQVCVGAEERVKRSSLEYYERPSQFAFQRWLIHKRAQKHK